MSKEKKDDKVKKLNPEHKTIDQITDPVIKRKVRMEGLATKIFKTVEAETKADGTFSIFEIIEVLVKVIHSYNKRFLNAEHQNLANEQNPNKG